MTAATCAAAFASTASAELRSNLRPVTGKVKTAKVLKVTDLSTGREIKQRNDGLRADVVAYDNLTHPLDPNGLVVGGNWCLVGPTIRPVCDPFNPDPNFAPTFVFTQPMAGDNCDPNNIGFENSAMPYLGSCLNDASQNNEDIQYDDYAMDASLADPNEVVQVTIHTYDWFFSAYESIPTPGGDGVAWTQLFYENTDIDGSGLIDFIGGYQVAFASPDPNDPNATGIYRGTVTLSDPNNPNVGVSALGAGELMTDIPSLTTGGNPACNYNLMMAGGFRSPAFAPCSPQDLIAVGDSITPFYWLLTSGTTSDKVPSMADPNRGNCTLSVDPNIDGAPGVSYTDIRNSNSFLNLQWGYPAGFGVLRFAHDCVNRLSIASAAPCVGDIDGDGDRDLQDLLTVLGSFGNPYTLQDLLNVLGGFGIPCP
jgi:hypothetical protein